MPACQKPSPPLDDRQLWVLEQLHAGVQLRRVDVERKFGVVQKTAKRDLAELVSSGVIEFVREGRGGFYRVTLRLLSPQGHAVSQRRS